MAVGGPQCLAAGAARGDGGGRRARTSRSKSARCWPSCRPGRASSRWRLFLRCRRRRPEREDYAAGNNAVELEELPCGGGRNRAAPEKAHAWIPRTDAHAPPGKDPPPRNRRRRRPPGCLPRPPGCCAGRWRWCCCSLSAPTATAGARKSTTARSTNSSKSRNIAKADVQGSRVTGEFINPPLDPERKKDRDGKLPKLEKKFATTLPPLRPGGP